MLLLAVSETVTVAIVTGVFAVVVALISARTTVFVTRATTKAASNERSIETEVADLRAENKRLKAELAKERRKHK